MEGLISILKTTVHNSQLLVKRLVAYQKLLAEPVRRAYEREKMLVDITRLVNELGGGEVKARLEEWLQGERTGVEEAKNEFRFEFGKQLFQGLAGSGMDVKGQLPFLRCGLFSVRVDFATGRATIFWGPEIERLKTGVPLEPFGLAKLLRSYQESLEKRAIREPEEFARRLFTAYRRLCGNQGISEGERVFLIDLLGEMVFLMQPEGFKVNPVKDRFVEYPRIRFSYDLYLLKRSGVRTVEGRQIRLAVANFAATAEKAKALWVPDNEGGEGTHYSYIAFVRAESGGAGNPSQ